MKQENIKIVEMLAKEICNIVDFLAKRELTVDTPIYNFQQEMIVNVNRYRQSKENETTTCEHSGIVFNKEGKLIDIT